MGVAPSLVADMVLFVDRRSDGGCFSDDRWVDGGGGGGGGLAEVCFVGGGGGGCLETRCEGGGGGGGGCFVV